MVNYAIPMNVICLAITLIFIIMKFRTMEAQKQIESDSSLGSSSLKKFESQVTPYIIKFRQSSKNDLVRLEQATLEIEAKSSTKIQAIDKLKVKLHEGDDSAMMALIQILRQQSFLREVSFYKMRFSTEADYDHISEIMTLRDHGIIKISFKDCSIKEGMLSHLSSKFKSTENEDIQLVKDVTLQMRVHVNTDYELLY
jgi:hypothetical protein